MKKGKLLALPTVAWLLIFFLIPLVFVLGNHEYYGRAVPEFLQEMDKIDIRILLDEVITIEDDFYLVGRSSMRYVMQ